MAAGTIRVGRPFKPGERETVVVIRGDDTLEHVVEAPPLYVSQFEDFGRAARGAAPPVVSLADSRGNTAALVAALEGSADAPTELEVTAHRVGGAPVELQREQALRPLPGAVPGVDHRQAVEVAAELEPAIAAGDLDRPHGAGERLPP